METLDKQTETTDARLAALRHIQAKYSCLDVALWLVDRSQGDAELLCSYHVGRTDLRAALLGLSIQFSYDTPEVNAPEILIRAQAEFAALTKNADSVTPIALYPTSRAISRVDAILPLLGVVTLHHQGELNEADLEHIAANISNVIEFTRLNRLATCVTNAQSFLSKTSKEIPSFLREIGFFMLSQLNSQRYMYINANRAEDWLEIEGDSLEELDDHSARRTFVIEELRPTQADQIRQVNLHFLRSDERSPAMLVPIPQAGYLVERIRFAKDNDFFRLLTKQTSDDIKLIFFEKNVTGYLQNRFSASDDAIANAVFGFVGKYIESIIFESNSNEVISHLDTEEMVQDDAASILKVLLSLTQKFKSITILRASRFEREIHFEIISATQILSGLDEYFFKIKGTYFKKFYENREGNKNNNHPAFGIDVIDGHTVLEVHFPRYRSDSRLYLVEFDGEIISESALRSFVNLFSDLFSRVMREENIRERGNYLVQVRHAVIHHFSAANRSLKSLRPLWERGQRDREYWLDLLKDPLVGSSLARTVNSLGQANLIIENGRFMIGELESSALNRKPYRIVELINTTLDILKYNRDDKRIVLQSKISGAPPKSMRGDGPLLSIALMNLFDNAIKYSPHFMKIRWRLEYQSDRYKLSISSVGDRLEPSARLMLFQEGYRGFQSDRLNRRHGTGLGLPVAYRILLAHSPVAQLNFEPFEHDPELDGPGNTFYFEMPYFAGSGARAASETDNRD